MSKEIKRTARLLSTFLVGAIMLVSTPALGATLMTAHLHAVSDIVACTVTNYSNAPLDVRIDQINYSGRVFTKTVTLAPLATETHGFAGTKIETSSCKFTFDGSKRSVRAAALVFNSDGIMTVALPAS